MLGKRGCELVFRSFAGGFLGGRLLACFFFAFWGLSERTRTDDTSSVLHFFFNHFLPFLRRDSFRI